MKASSSTKRPPAGQHPLQPVVDRLHAINKRHPDALLSFRENQTLNPDTVRDLTSRRGGLLGRLLRPFGHRQRLAEESTKAMEFLIRTLDRHQHSLSPEIAKEGRRQLENLLQRPLGKGMPVQEALDIYQDMLHRQLHQCSDAAARARSADEAYRQRFDDQRQQPPQLPTSQVLAPDQMAHNAQTLSDAYREAAGKASRGEPDAGPPPANLQAGALGQLAPLLQILQTAIDSPDGHQARQLQDVWEGLACPQDIEEAFTPLRFSQHVQTLLQSCSDALRALKQAQSDGDLREMRTCCEGYVACFEQLIVDLTAAARDLLGALADGQLPAGLPTPDRVFLLDLGETLLAAAKALADAESPSMANHQSALALLARDDARLRTVLRHWSRPPRPNHAPPSERTPVTAPALASPRQPWLRAGVSAGKNLVFTPLRSPRRPHGGGGGARPSTAPPDGLSNGDRRSAGRIVSTPENPRISQKTEAASLPQPPWKTDPAVDEALEAHLNDLSDDLLVPLPRPLSASTDTSALDPLSRFHADIRPLLEPSGGGTASETTLPSPRRPTAPPQRPPALRTPDTPFDEVDALLAAMPNAGIYGDEAFFEFNEEAPPPQATPGSLAPRGNEPHPSTHRPRLQSSPASMETARDTAKDAQQPMKHVRRLLNRRPPGSRGKP